MLWQRQCIVQIGRPAIAGREYRGLRVSFDVSMSQTSTPNTGKIELYNPSPESVSLAQRPDAVVQLFVGHDLPRLVFRGEPVADGVRLERRGVDRVLVVEASDGGRAYTRSRVSVSYSTSTSARQVLDTLTARMGLAVGTVRLPADVAYPSGLALVGRASDLLDDVCRSAGCVWYIRDGAIHVHETGGSTGESAVVFSSEAGNLIGSPTRKDGGVEVTALLAPSLRPGKPFVVDSIDVQGAYTATDVQFVGDSGYDQSFYVRVTGRPRAM